MDIEICGKCDMREECTVYVRQVRCVMPGEYWDTLYMRMILDGLPARLRPLFFQCFEIAGTGQECKYHFEHRMSDLNRGGDKVPDSELAEALKGLDFKMLRSDHSNMMSKMVMKQILDDFKIDEGNFIDQALMDLLCDSAKESEEENCKIKEMSYLNEK